MRLVDRLYAEAQLLERNQPSTALPNSTADEGAELEDSDTQVSISSFGPTLLPRSFPPASFPPSCLVPSLLPCSLPPASFPHSLLIPTHGLSADAHKAATTVSAGDNGTRLKLPTRHFKLFDEFLMGDRDVSGTGGCWPSLTIR